MRFRDIKRFKTANYRVDVSLGYVLKQLESWADGQVVELDPPYQRGYVWTREQAISYLEYIFKGGISGRDIFWNCSSWFKGFDTPVVLVDGKQRIKAVMDFLCGELPIFGHYLREFEDVIPMVIPSLCFHVNDLEDPVEIVQWYIDMNTGGTYHTEKDLSVAKEYLESLKKDKEDSERVDVAIGKLKKVTKKLRKKKE